MTKNFTIIVKHMHMTKNYQKNTNVNKKRYMNMTRSWEKKGHHEEKGTRTLQLKSQLEVGKRNTNIKGEE
jgi:hypothetical protein